MKELGVVEPEVMKETEEATHHLKEKMVDKEVPEALSIDHQVAEEHKMQVLVNLDLT
jgi:hypothetical protein